MGVIARLTRAPCLPVLLVLLVAVTLEPVTAQYRHMLFGPLRMPRQPAPCRCVPAHLCPALLVTASGAASCAGPGMVCCLTRAAASPSHTVPRGPAPAGPVGRSCGRPGRPDSGPAWTVAVTRRDPDGLLYSSAGALLSPTLVITVAQHVIQAPVDQLVVVANMEDLLGDSEQEVFRRVSAVIPHSRYYPGDQQHNLALLRLETPLEPGGTLAPSPSPVCLPLPPAPPADTEGSCWASGWGKDVASHDSTAAPLLDVRVRFASRSECLGSLADRGQQIDLSADLCMKPRSSEDDLCWLDPGSPVVCPTADGSATLVGLVSWARRCAGRRRAPMVVAAAIAPHLEWIMNVLEA